MSTSSSPKYTIVLFTLIPDTFLTCNTHILFFTTTQSSSSSTFNHTYLCTSQTGDSRMTTSLKQMWTAPQRRSLELHKMERGYPPLQSLTQGDGQLNNGLFFLHLWCSIVGTLFLLPAWCLPCSGEGCSPPSLPPAVPGRSHWASGAGSCPTSPAGRGALQGM